MNSAVTTEWLISSDVRSRYSQAGAVLLDFGRGHYYTLNGFAARVWAVIETSPSGIAFEDVVDAVETHFEALREELRRDVAECLADLEGEGLARGRIAARNESAADHISSSSDDEGQAREPGHEEKQGMTVTLFSRAESEPVIELALGAETRSFPLSEFLHFWLTIIEVGFRRDVAELESGEPLRRRKGKR